MLRGIIAELILGYTCELQLRLNGSHGAAKMEGGNRLQEVPSTAHVEGGSHSVAAFGDGIEGGSTDLRGIPAVLAANHAAFYLTEQPVQVLQRR